MRFIEGDSLGEAIGAFHRDERLKRDPAARNARLRELLRRFTDVCNAVAYAHSRGVLHRDLKSGNIMLGPYGETLVVDWGLAKPLGLSLPGGQAPEAPSGSVPSVTGGPIRVSDRSESPSDTVAGEPIGTPTYASPEQVIGDLSRLGPATDVYGLGATLYSLLTGRPPVETKDLGEAIRLVRKGEIESPRSIDAAIPRALEAICQKAMALNPADRYASARALALDVTRWLGDEPVTARRDSLWARSWRWVRKHRTLSTSAAAVVLLSKAGLGIGLQRERQNAARIGAERTEAERRLDQVMTSYEDYFSGFNEEVLRDRKLPPELLESLLAKPRAFYERLTNELAAKPNPTAKERALLARGRYSLGRMLRTLGRHAESEHENEEAFRMYAALARDRPGVPDYQHRLASSYNGLGLVLAATGRRREAEKAYGKAVAALKRLVAQNPERMEYRSRLGRYLNDLGRALLAQGDIDSAIAQYGEAIDH